MHFLTPLLPFAFGGSLLLFTPNLTQLAWINGAAQLLLFAMVVCIPAWKTGRLSYVDIGWPLGLALIGVMTLVLAEGQPLRKLVVSLVYLFIGLRMGLGALKMWRSGYFQTEFPRYQYQRLRWERKGIRNIPLMIQIEALVQGLAANIRNGFLPAIDDFCAVRLAAHSAQSTHISLTKSGPDETAP